MATGIRLFGFYGLRENEMAADLAKLGRFIADNFDLDQLRLLCDELDVSYERLLGDTRSARAFDLVTLVEERGQLSALLAAVARARPDAFDPHDFQTLPASERGTDRRKGWIFLLTGGVVLVVGLAFLLTRDLGVPSAFTATPLGVARSTSSFAPRPSPSATFVSPTSVPFSPTPTAPPTATLTPSPSGPAVPTVSPRPTATPVPSATFTPTPVPSATPMLSSFASAWIYDDETRTLVLAPGGATAGRARLCTPLNAYHLPGTIHLVENVVEQLDLPLPARARVSHSYPERLGRDTIVRTLEVRSHPQQGVKVSGEEADFTGCDLLVSEEMRITLGFPVALGAFDDPARFDHGWVTIEVLGSLEPANP